MSTEFGLYHQSSKTFIWLGKVLSKSTGYQTPAHAIAEFMAGQQEGQFRIVADSDDLPENKEDGWREIGDWPWPDDDGEHDMSDGLVAFYPRLDGFPDNIGTNDVRIYNYVLTAAETWQEYANS